MPLTYLEWIARNDRNNWYGIAGTVSREFNSWTLHSGSVYKVNWPPAGQVYSLDEVWENGVLLTKDAAIPTLAGHWFHDRTVKPNVLYVRASDSGNPYSKTIIGKFSARFCSGIPVGKTTADLNSVPWRSCLTQRSQPVIDYSLGSFFYGTAVFGSISISFINADGYFDKLYADWQWKDSLFTVVHGDGGVELSYAEHYKTAFVCKAVKLDTQELNLTLENNFGVLDQSALTARFDKAVYPAMSESLQGAWIPELYGETRIPLYCIDEGQGIFKAVNHPLDEMRAIEIDGKLVDESIITRDLANGQVTILLKVQGVTAQAKPGDTDMNIETHYLRVAALVRGQAENKERR